MQIKVGLPFVLFSSSIKTPLCLQVTKSAFFSRFTHEGCHWWWWFASPHFMAKWILGLGKGCDVWLWNISLVTLWHQGQTAQWEPGQPAKPKLPPPSQIYWFNLKWEFHWTTVTGGDQIWSGGLLQPQLSHSSPVFSGSCFHWGRAEHISAPSILEVELGVRGMHFCRGAQVARKPNKQQVYLQSPGPWKLELSGRNTLQWELSHLIIPGRKHSRLWRGADMCPGTLQGPDFQQHCCGKNAEHNYFSNVWRKAKKKNQTRKPQNNSNKKTL